MNLKEIPIVAISKGQCEWHKKKTSKAMGKKEILGTEN